MRTVFYLFVVLLAGCATPEQIAARQAYEQQQQAANQEAYRQRVENQCRAYGFTERDAEFRQCLMQVDQANRQRSSQMENAILQQMLQDDSQARPSCASLPPGMASAYRAQGRCR